MAEDIREIEKQPPKFSRRTAIKAGAAALLGGLAIKRELPVAEEGLETPNGIFYPLYERHDRGIDVADLPPNLDAFFREGVLRGKDNFESPPSSILLVNYQLENQLNLVGGEVQFIKEPVLLALARKQTNIIVGDVDIGIELSQESAGNWDKRYLAGLIVGATGVLYAKMRQYLDEATGKQPNKGELSRRSFLKKASLGAGALLVIPSFVDLAIPMVELSLGSNLRQKDAVERIVGRMEGLNTHLIPENHLIFFRNLMMADKILTVAEAMKKEQGKKPKIAFNVGGAHTGLEDFLVAGTETIHWMISQYPKDFLKKVIDNVGGIDNFADARVFTLPPDLTPELLHSDQLDNSISEKRIMDEKLARLLHKEFAGEEAAVKKEFVTKRENDITQLSTTLDKYLSPEVNNQFASIFTLLKNLNERDYRQIVKTEHIQKDDFENYSFSITLPKGNPPYQLMPSKDIEVKIDYENGKLVQEEISFFQDASGKITANPNDANVARLTPESLKPQLLSTFKGIPDNPDPNFWQYTPVGGVGTPAAGQGFLRPQIIQDEASKKQYHISLDGRRELLVWYK